MSAGSLIKQTLSKFFRSVGLWQTFRLPKKEMWVDEYALKYYATYSSQLFIIYPATIQEERPPKVLDSEISWKFQSLYKRHLPEAFVLRLPDGRVHGAKGTIITRESVLLRDVSREFGNRSLHSLFQQLYIGEPKRLSGNVAVLVTEGGDTYYHWLFDILTRIHLLEEAGLLPDLHYFILPKINSRFKKETLQLLNIDHSKIIEADAADFHMVAENLFVPSLPSLLGTVNKWACSFLQKKILAHKLPEVTTGDRIFISRSKAPNRKLTNENELAEVLSNNGFDIVRSEEYSFLEQVAIYHKASVIVAPHGSGLSNIVFSRPGTIVVELLSADFIVPCFWIIANNSDLKYFFISDKEKDSNPYSPYWEGKSTDYDFPREKLERLLHNLNLLQ